MSGEKSASSVVQFGTTGDDYVLPGQRFEFEAYLEEWSTLVEHAEHDSAEIERLRKRGDWDELYRKSVRMKAEGVRRIHEHLRSQKKLNDGIRAIEEANERAEQFHGEPGSAAEFDPGEVVSALKEQVSGAYRSALPDDETLEEWLGSSGQSARNVDASESAETTVFTERLRDHRNLAIWYITAGFETAFRASLYDEIDGASPERRSTAAVEATEAFFEEIRGEAVDLLQDYFGALAAGEFDLLESRAWRGTSFPFEVSEQLVAVGAMLRRGRLHERDQGGSGREFAELEAQLHRLSRLLTLLLAASYRYLFVARQGDLHEEARSEVERARETAFESQIVDGLNVDVDELVENPTEYDGRLVETTGFVENVQYRPDGAPGTRFDVVDGEDRIQVFSPYRHLNVWALREGAFVHLNGKFTASSEHADDDPEIELDVVEAGGHAEESWFDHVVNEFGQNNADVFALYPSHTNAIWSLELPTGGEAE